MSIKAIKEARKAKPRDRFENGTVIRWTSGGRYNYAAIKTPVGWVTTAREYNRHCPQTCSFETLVDVLSASDVTDVEIAQTWRSVDDDQ